MSLRLLAADLTSFASSLALFQDGEALEEIRWRNETGRHQDFFRHLREGLARHGWRPADIGAFVAGRGPGNFSGMRTALAAFDAMALPFGIPVRAVSSGRALAAEAFAENPAALEVVVIGDARRDALWCGRFPRPAGGRLPGPVEYQRIAVAGAGGLLAGGSLVISPDATRLASVLPALCRAGTDRAPSAAWLARIAAAELDAGDPGEPAEPIYLHPPVRESS